MVQGLEFGAWDKGLRVEGWRLRAYLHGTPPADDRWRQQRAQAPHRLVLRRALHHPRRSDATHICTILSRLQGLVLWVEGLGSRVLSFEFRDEGLRLIRFGA